MIMEAKINIAEILRDKPVNTKLYSPLFGDVYFSHVKDSIINVKHHAGESKFLNSGRYYNYVESEPLLFPSKEMRDWSKFAWKKGDVLVSNDGSIEVIFDKWYDDTYTSFYGKHYLNSENENDIRYLEEFICSTWKYSLEDTESFLFYVTNIEERLGGKLNFETLEIDKQPEFKDGDIVVYGKSVAICRKIHKHTYCFYVSIDETFGLLFDYNTVSSEECRFAEEEEKQELFNALAKKGKAWDAEKKQIVDLKPKWTPKPFDRVITRGDNDSIWTANIFSHIDRYGQYVAIGCIGGYPYCIPYNEETVKLIGTTDEWKGDN